MIVFVIRIIGSTCQAPSVDRGVVKLGEVEEGSDEQRFQSQCMELHLAYDMLNFMLHA